MYIAFKNKTQDFIKINNGQKNPFVKQDLQIIFLKELIL